MKKIFFFLIFTFSNQNIFAHSDYFISGSGEISLKNDKKNSSVKIRYREGENQYNEAALKKINQVYGSPYEISTERMSLRFLELLSYLQKHFNGATIHILSGYRSPTLNQGLRNQGKLAAISSMHIESAAADIFLEGIEITEVRDFLMNLNCCGVGYYHGRHVHLDTGPKRFWDEKTSGTEKKEPQENEKIIALTDKDIYSSKNVIPGGDKIRFNFVRISDYPINTAGEVILEKQNGSEWKKTTSATIDSFQAKSFGDCESLSERKKTKDLKLTPKEKLPPGKYRLQISFCKKEPTKMPDSITSNEFEILKD